MGVHSNFKNIEEFIQYRSDLLIEATLKDHRETVQMWDQLLREKQCGFRPDRSTTYMTFMVCRLERIVEAGILLSLCFIVRHSSTPKRRTAQSTSMSVNRTPLWQVIIDRR